MVRFTNRQRVAYRDVEAHQGWAFGEVVGESIFADGGVTIEPDAHVGDRVHVSKSRVREVNADGKIADHYHLIDEDGERAMGWHASWNDAMIVANRYGWDGVTMTVAACYAATYFESCA